MTTDLLVIERAIKSIFLLLSHVMMMIVKDFSLVIGSVAN